MPVEGGEASSPPSDMEEEWRGPSYEREGRGPSCEREGRGPGYEG